jgi:hypothetical protein
MLLTVEKRIFLVTEFLDTIGWSSFIVANFGDGISYVVFQIEGTSWVWWNGAFFGFSSDAHLPQSLVTVLVLLEVDISGPHIDSQKAIIFSVFEVNDIVMLNVTNLLVLNFFFAAAILYWLNTFGFAAFLRHEV